MNGSSLQLKPTTPTHATQEMVRTRETTPQRTRPGNGYAGNQAALRRLSRTTPQLQRKLEIGAVHDPLEAEADRVAEQVMRMPDPALSSADAPSMLRRKCAGCEEEDRNVARKETGAAALDGAQAPASVHTALAAPGMPLAPVTREFFEPRLGQELSDVRVHTDPVAANSARAVGAHAYTVGRDIVFADGAYAPNSAAGRKLIAHELAHVMQQSGRSASALRRLGDLSKVPGGLSCPIPPSGAPPATDFLLFPNLDATLSPAHKTRIAAFVANWKATGNGATVRIDGFASEPGADALNWQLSCNRAMAVKSEMMSPSGGTSPGIPEGSITIFMQGETSEFGSDEQNRRVSLSFSAAPAPATPAPAPATPAPAPATPAPAPATPAPAPSLPIPTVDCTASNVSELAPALPVARNMVHHAITVLGRSGDARTDALLDKYFNDHSASTYLHALIGFNSLLAIDNSFTLECEQPGSFLYGHFCSGTKGYTRSLIPGANVHICGDGFGTGVTDLAWTIVHECSHKFDNTGDKAYCDTGCPPTLDRWDAYNNADSFSGFAAEALATIP